MGIDLVSACVFCAAFLFSSDLPPQPGLTAEMGLSYATLSRKYPYAPDRNETSDVTPKFVMFGLGNAHAPAGELGAGTPASEWKVRFAVAPSHDEAARRPDPAVPDLPQVTATGNGRYENFALLGRFRIGDSDSLEMAIDRRSHKSTDLLNVGLSNHSLSEERTLGSERVDAGLGWRHRWNHFEAAASARFIRLTGYNTTANYNSNSSGKIIGLDVEGRMRQGRWSVVLHADRTSGPLDVVEQYFPSFESHATTSDALLEAARLGVGYSWPRTELFLSATLDRQRLPWVTMAVLGTETVAFDGGFHPDSNTRESLYDLSARYAFTPAIRVQASVWLGYGSESVTLTDAVDDRPPILLDVKRRGDFGGGLSRKLGSPQVVLFVGANFLIGSTGH
jgi:hypothetical protein